MRGIKNLLLMITMLLAIAACKPAIEKDAAKIKAMEDELFSPDQASIDKAKALELIDLYVAYANAYPEDSMAVENLFKSAEFCLNLGEGPRSIELYDRVINEYPEFRKVPECLFLKGYVYENYLGDLDRAKIIYTEFMERYPNNEFADDAEISIQNLGKSPEELIRQFEEEQIKSDPE